MGKPVYPLIFLTHPEKCLESHVWSPYSDVPYEGLSNVGGAQCLLLACPILHARSPISREALFVPPISTAQQIIATVQYPPTHSGPSHTITRKVYCRKSSERERIKHD